MIEPLQNRVNFNLPMEIRRDELKMRDLKKLTNKIKSTDKQKNKTNEDEIVNECFRIKTISYTVADLSETKFQFLHSKRNSSTFYIYTQ